MDGFLIAASSAASPAATLLWLGATAWIVLKVAAGLGFVIFVHELGHFLVAKACGVKCEKFYVGFDVPIRIGPFQLPAALWKKQWGETEYGIGILPLGGYVKMLGQDDNPANAEAEAERIKVAGESGKPALDPRSYPAKSVPARMAIISAGVTMNLIFAVVLATIAYRLGVPYMPAVVGATVPGDPAWNAGWQPGDQILQIGRNGKRDEHLRFDDDLLKQIVFNGDDRDLEFLIRKPDGEEQWHTLRPTGRTKKETKRPTIGIRPASTLEIAAPAEEPEDLRAQATPPLASGDRLVAVGGEPVDSLFAADALLARQPAGPLTITVERQEPTADQPADSQPPKVTRHEITLAPRPMRTVGLVMQPGPILAVRPHSPAALAGVQPGDILTAIDGQPLGNPLSLDQRLRARAGEEVALTVSRAAGAGREEKQLTAKLAFAPQLEFHYVFGEPVGVETLGLAFSLTPEVAAVEPDSPAAKAGLQAGDRLTAVRFEPSSPEQVQQELKRIGSKDVNDLQFQLNDTTKNWQRAFGRMQFVLPDTKLVVTFERGGKSQSAPLEPVPAADFFDASRGLNFAVMNEVNTAHSWGQALFLGARETKERLEEVLTVLSQLVTGRISATNLSGPAGILYVAGNQAALGFSKLLIFLTLLSANLAIINFLPIPVLDGGHMVFLAAEWIRGKPVDERLQMWLSGAGLIFLLALMVFATTMDVGRFFF